MKSWRRPQSKKLCSPRPAAVRIFLAAALTLSAAWAQGGFEGPGVYELLNKNSDKVVDLDRNDETTVIQFESRGTDNQQWEIRPADDGFYYLINLMNGHALEAGGKGEPAAGRPFAGSPAQQWRFEEGRDGTALIVNRNGLALDVPGDSRSNGARLQVTSRNGSAAQRFLLRFIGEADPFGDVEEIVPTSPPTPSAPAPPSPPAAETRYIAAPACHEAIRTEVRRQYGSGAYLIYPSAGEQWQDRGMDRLYGKATVKTGSRSENVEYNCLGDPREGRVVWAEVRRTGASAR